MKKFFLSIMIALVTTSLLCGCGKLFKGNDSESLEIEIEEDEDWYEFQCFSKEAKIIKTEIYEDENVVITANELKQDDFFNEHLNLTIENKTDIMVNIYHNNAMREDCTAINGYICQVGAISGADEDISPGEKIDIDMEIASEAFNKYGFEGIAEIQLNFLIKLNPKENDEMRYVTPPVTLKTSLYNSFDFNKDYVRDAIETGLWDDAYYLLESFVDDTFIDENGIKVYDAFYIAYQDEIRDKGPFDVGFVIENKSQEYLELQIDNIVVDGYQIFDRPTVNLMPENKSLIKISLSFWLPNSFNQIVGTDDIGTVSFDILDKDGGYINSANISYNKEINVNDVSGDKVYNENGIIVEKLPVIEAGENGIVLPVQVTNLSGNDLKFKRQVYRIDDIEKEVDVPFSYKKLYNNNKCILSIYDRELSLEDTKNVEVLLDIECSEEITLNIKY